MRVLRWIIASCLAMAGLTASLGAEEAQWVEARSRNFLVFTDTGEAKARRLLEDLEGRAAVLSSLIGPIPERPFPIEVFVFNKGQDFTEVTGLEPEKSAYLFRGPDRVFVLARDKSPEDIANDAGHALGHALFERSTLWRPFWLAEGTAEYFRKAGRKPEVKAVPREEGFTARDLLRIVPSVGYRDSDPPGASRIQSHRLLRVIAEQHPDALQGFLKTLRTEAGEKAKIDLDSSLLEEKLNGYVETVIPLTPRALEIRTTIPSADRLAIHRGDLLIAAGKHSLAAEKYSGTGPDARGARAILTRYTRNPVEAARALERAARELPEDALVQLHFGSIEVTSPPDLIAAQAVSLEQAVKLLPQSGRAAAELARLYTIIGYAERAVPLTDRAIALEPEFGDRFYEIRAQALAGLKRFDDAYRTMKLSAALPHTGEKIDAIYEQKVKVMAERAEGFRRDSEATRVEQIRQALDRAATLAEPPPPPPPPPPPVRQGGMNYAIESEIDVVIVNRVYPEFPNALLSRGVGGEIVFAVTAGPDGRVSRLELVSSELPDLNAATTAALRRWTFKPAEVDGRPAPFRMTLTFRYEIQEVDALPGLR